MVILGAFSPNSRLEFVRPTRSDLECRTAAIGPDYDGRTPGPDTQRAKHRKLTGRLRLADESAREEAVFETAEGTGKDSWSKPRANNIRRSEPAMSDPLRLKHRSSTTGSAGTRTEKKRTKLCTC